MSTGRPILVDRAGPSRAPAAVLHPDDPIPKTWRVVSEWSYRGQRGVWLDRNPELQSYKVGHPSTPMLAQVVYRTTAKRSPRVSTTGQGLNHAARALVCNPGYRLHWDEVPQGLDYRAPDGTGAQEEADIAARAAHLGLGWGELHRMDREAIARYKASLQQPPPAPPNSGCSRCGFQHSGPCTTPSPAVQAAAKRLVTAFAAALKPTKAQQPQLIDELDLPMRAYYALRRNNVTLVSELLALSDSQILRMRNMGQAALRDIDANLAALGLHRSRVGVNVAPSDEGAANDNPSEPGLYRAKWIGDRITAMTAREDARYLPHTRRRIAAHRALSIVAGYTPQDAENDGLTLPGGFLLHLEGLNAYAARAFAGEED